MKKRRNANPEKFASSISADVQTHAKPFNVTDTKFGLNEKKNCLQA